MQNTEPPKDAREGEQKGNPSPLPGAWFVYPRQQKARSPGLPRPPSLKPPTGSRGGLRGSNLSRSPGPPPPPGLVFPSSGGWARGWGARRVGARSGSRVGAGTRSWLWRRQARR